ncbi:unnamed protein product [Sphagnum troendelagicum]|uniref:Golgi to ER traffic protein 4 n=1 Tax=Sphagnum troendelagicum TaxID=128251 RepID=A0ABP0UAU8_9BRYO
MELRKNQQLEKLEKRVQDGNYYEAQQMYKTINSRYMAAKKYAESIDLLQSGAVMQLKHGQVTCGTELGVLLIDTYNTAKVPCDTISIDRIRAIFNEFPRASNFSQEKVDIAADSKATEKTITAKTHVEGCMAFLKAALKWSIEAGGPHRGAPELHDMLADYVWTQSPVPEMYKASQYFVRGSHPETFAKAVVQWMHQCYPGEADLVVARAVLLYLSLGNLRDANLLWDAVKQSLSDSSKEFPDTPLMHFIRFLLSTLERDALPLFRILRQKYKPSIDRDPTFDEYMDEIGERFYGLQRRNGGMQGMLSDFIKMFATDS